VKEHRLVRAGPVAVAPLRSGFHIVSHVLGHSRLLCDARTLEILAWHARPRLAAEVAAHFAESDRAVSFVLGHLVQAQLLAPATLDVRARIRDAFGSRRAPTTASAPSIPLPARGGVQQWGAQETDPRPAAFALTSRSRLTLSPYVASMPVAPGETIALHPLGARTHLRDRVWKLARAFEAPTTIAAAAAKLGIRSSEEALAACRFLVLRGLLWPSRAAERRALATLADRLGLHEDGPSVRQWSEPQHQWTDVATPYDWAAVRRLDAFGRVAVVGQCQINFASAALQRLAQSHGVYLDLFAEPVPSSALGGSAWAAVFLSLADAAVGLHEAAARGDLEGARDRIPGLLAHMDALVLETRRHTRAPIAVLSVAPPSLSAISESASARHLRARVYAELNDRLAGALRDRDAYLIDESAYLSAATSRRAHEVVLDDEYAGSAHHCAYNPRFWIPLTHWPASMTASSEAHPLPQGDPQAGASDALAPALFDFLRRRHGEPPVRAVVFDPDTLLWPGHLAEKPLAHESLQRAMGRPDYQLYCGTNEAFLAVRARGVKLVCASPLAESVLREKWNVPASSDAFVSADHLDAIAKTPREISAALARLGVRPEECLWVASTAASSSLALEGARVFRGESWSLKRYLFTAPELTPALARIEAPAPAVAVSPILPSPPPSSLGPDREAAIEQSVDAAIGRHLNVAAAEIRRTDDLRQLGLDSLTALALARDVERAIGAELADQDLTIATIYRRSTLLASALRASRARDATHHPRSDAAAPRPSAPSALETAHSFAEVIIRNANAGRHPWQLKMVRSTKPNDYDYVGWGTLLERASGYADLFARTGAAPGDVITLMLPQGTALIAAFLGAILYDFVPSIVASPNEKLSPSAFASWFGAVAERSATRLVVCEETCEALVRACIAASAAPTIQVSSASPSPTARTSAPIGRSPNRPLLLQHSSGTTGLKKAVLLSEEPTLTQVRNLARALHCDSLDVVVSWAPLYHDMGLVACLLLPLLADLPLVMMSPFDWLKCPELLLREIARERGTLSWMPNFAFLYMAQRIADASLRGLDVASWRAVINCSEPVTERASEALLAKLAQVGLRRSSLSASYAMAETTFAVTQVPPGRGVTTLPIDAGRWRAEGIAQRADETTESVTVLTGSGEILAGAEVAIVAPDGSLQPEGHAGEIRVRSDSMMSGYFGDARATSAAIADGWYATGDVGLLFGRELYVTGRKKDLVIVAGHNVYPHDVEESVGSIPGVKPGRVVTFGVHDESLDTERLVILAETIDSRANDGDLALLRERIRAHVSSVFGVTPSDVRLFGERTLLKSTSGKLSRAQNRALYLGASKGARTPPQHASPPHQASIETDPPHGT
jgi:fatty-acyl-CoA synthase